MTLQSSVRFGILLGHQLQAPIFSSGELATARVAYEQLVRGLEGRAERLLDWAPGEYHPSSSPIARIARYFLAEKQNRSARQ